MLLIAVCLVAPMSVMADSKLDKSLRKAMDKEKKEKVKQYKKGGWEVVGSNTIDVALLKHYKALEDLGENGQEVLGISTTTKSKNTGIQMAMNNAVITYGQMAGSDLQGRVVSDLAANGTDTAGEFEHFYAAYERLVQKEIKNEMQNSFTVMRQNPDGTYEVQSYFIVNENAASKARIRAMENAMRESEAAQKYANKISEFVQAGFNR